MLERDEFDKNWLRQLADLYESGAYNQFVLHGNISDIFPALSNTSPKNKATPKSGANSSKLNLSDKVFGGTSLREFIIGELLQPFEFVFDYDAGNGLRILRGADIFELWPSAKLLNRGGLLARNPADAIAVLHSFLRFRAKLVASDSKSSARLLGQCAFFIKDADLLFPVSTSLTDLDLLSMMSVIREWSREGAFVEQEFVCFLLAGNLAALHPLLAANISAASVEIPLPNREDIEKILRSNQKRFSKSLANFLSLKRKSKTSDKLATLAGELRGASNASILALLKIKEHNNDAIEASDLGSFRKELIEKDARKLLEFIEPRNTLDDLHGCEPAKKRFAQDAMLWRAGKSVAMPMGYLLSGAVGTGKTFAVSCLAGEIGAPIVRLKNFRDRWIGSSEGNLETIFSVLRALGKCVVFIDEADQSLGKRNSGSGDSGLSGRLYSMFATQMSMPENRGRIIWILASSRPDLIEIDLKRPGRIDVKIPLFPTSSPEDSFSLLRALCKKYGLRVPKNAFEKLHDLLPLLLTAGAAEAIAVKARRQQEILKVKGKKLSATNLLTEVLKDFSQPVPRKILLEQIRISAMESSDRDFIPEGIKKLIKI